MEVGVPESIVSGRKKVPSFYENWCFRIPFERKPRRDEVPTGICERRRNETGHARERRPRF